MKVGIITFHCAHNYGAVLQAYALQDYLKTKGHQVFIIDYSPEYLRRAYNPFRLCYWVSSNIKRTFYKLFTEPYLLPKRIEKFKFFKRFIQDKFNLYPYELLKEGDDFDAIVLGSDQIWNPNLLNGNYDECYFGAGLKCKVISYAASMGTDSLSSKEMIFFTQRLKKLHAIGVREESIKKILQPLTDKIIQVTVDPTLLCDKLVFDKIANIPKINKPYILIYQIARYDETIEIAQHIASQIGGEVFELMSDFSFSGSNKILTAAPEDFIGYFKNATCIITTSFHGTAFSLIYNKPFYTIKQNSKADMRVASLLNILGLENRFVDKTEMIKYEDIDYNLINDKISDTISKSKRFINDALEL